MDPYIKITKKFTKKSGSKVINRQYFHRKTGLKSLLSSLLNWFKLVYGPLEQNNLISAQTSQQGIKFSKAKELVRAYCPYVYIVWDLSRI